MTAMNADKAAILVNRKRADYGLPPVSLTVPQREAAYKSLVEQARFKGVSLETAVDATVRLQYQSHLLGRPL